jgi:hypothetical protein
MCIGLEGRLTLSPGNFQLGPLAVPRRHRSIFIRFRLLLR